MSLASDKERCDCNIAPSFRVKYVIRAPFPAQFDKACEDCFTRWTPGDRIVMLDLGSAEMKIDLKSGEVKSELLIHGSMLILDEELFLNLVAATSTHSREPIDGIPAHIFPLMAAGLELPVPFGARRNPNGEIDFIYKGPIVPVSHPMRQWSDFIASRTP